MNNVKKVYIVVGGLALALGTVGCFVPFLPTFPFFLLTGVCFAKGSDTLYEKFTSSKLYERNFKSFQDGKGMKRSTKVRVILSVGFCCTAGFFLTESMTVKIIITAVLVLHILYFVFGIKNYGN